MAKTSALNVTNTTTSLTKSLTLYDMDELTNYGMDRSTNRADYRNALASSQDARENFAFFSSPGNVKPFKPTVTYPSALRTASQQKKSGVNEGVQYGVILDDIVTETDTVDTSYRVDYPVRITIRVEHQDHPAITNAMVRQLLGRAVSTLVLEDNSDRIGMLRGGVLQITAE